MVVEELSAANGPALGLVLAVDRIMVRLGRRQLGKFGLFCFKSPGGQQGIGEDDPPLGMHVIALGNAEEPAGRTKLVDLTAGWVLVGSRQGQAVRSIFSGLLRDSFGGGQRQAGWK